MYNGGVNDMRALFDWLRAEVGGCAIQMTEYVQRDFSLVDVTSSEATKGRALAWRAQQLGLSRDEVIAIGDNFNDVEMLEFAAQPVLM